MAHQTLVLLRNEKRMRENHTPVALPSPRIQY